MDHTPLEAALLDVHSTLSELLVAADDQYAAVAQRDRDGLEGVTRRQEQLAARLERAERQRVAALDGAPIRSAIAALPQDRGRRAARAWPGRARRMATSCAAIHQHTASRRRHSLRTVGRRRGRSN